MLLNGDIANDHEWLLPPEITLLGRIAVLRM